MTDHTADFAHTDESHHQTNFETTQGLSTKAQADQHSTYQINTAEKSDPTGSGRGHDSYTTAHGQRIYDMRMWKRNKENSQYEKCTIVCADFIQSRMSDIIFSAVDFYRTMIKY